MGRVYRGRISRGRVSRGRVSRGRVFRGRVSRVGYPGGMSYRRVGYLGGVTLPPGYPTLPPSRGYFACQYVLYWNAFLFFSTTGICICFSQLPWEAKKTELHVAWAEPPTVS